MFKGFYLRSNRFFFSLVDWERGKKKTEMLLEVLVRAQTSVLATGGEKKASVL